MEQNWPVAREYTGISEGGFSSHPKDRGGATNFGITQAKYDAWRRRRHERPQPVSLITQGEVATILKVDYWDLARCKDLPAGLDYAVFDAAVHHGVAGAVTILQRAINAKHGGADIKVDGVPGSVTLDRADDLPVDVMINAMCDERIDYMKTREGWATFEDGWRKRASDCRKNALAMAILDPAPPREKPKPLAPSVDEPPFVNPAADPKATNWDNPALLFGGLLAALFAALSFLFGN